MGGPPWPCETAGGLHVLQAGWTPGGSAGAGTPCGAGSAVWGTGAGGVQFFYFVIANADVVADPYRAEFALPDERDHVFDLDLELLG